MNNAPYRQVAEISLTLPGWVGDVDDLARIVGIVDALANDAVAKAQGAAASPARRTEYVNRLPSEWGDETLETYWQKRVTDHQKEIIEALKTTLVVKHRRFGRELKGEPVQVLADADVDDVIEVQLLAGSIYGDSSGGYGVETRFTRSDGCELRAKGEDPNWVASVESRIKDELQRRRPGYWWLRKSLVAYALGWVVLAPVFVWMVVLVGGLPVDARSGILGLTGWVITFLAAAVALGVRKALPAFELVRAGKQARGARIVGIAISVIAWVSALVIPFMLDI